MKISVIGAGNVGGALGKLWAEKGHQVMFGVRDAAKIQPLLNDIRGLVEAGSVVDAVAFGEVVVITVPWTAVYGVLEQGDYAGKIVIDATNRFGQADGDTHPSAAEDIAARVPRASVVKAFNTLGANRFSQPDFAGQNASMFICGDDAQAKVTVGRLTAELGFDVVDCGDLSNAPLLENLAKLWIWLARNGFGRDIAFKLLQ